MAPWPSAVSGRADIALISSRCSCELPASVAPRFRAAPVRPQCPEALGLASSKQADVYACASKMRDQARKFPEGLLLDRHAFHASVHSKQHILPAEQGFGDRQSFFVSCGVKCDFPGLLVSTEPRKMRAVAPKLERLVRHKFCCALAGGFRAHPF